MKMNAKNISHIDTKIALSGDQTIVEINVTERDGVKWSDLESNYNIYCIDKDYNIIWQVKEAKSKPVSIFGEADPFCYLKKNDKGEIIADRFSGFTYKIDPRTGEATQVGFHK